MFGFVYLTENLINGKMYIGKHCAKNLDDDRYLGSGTALKTAIKKYGVANFRREIISIAATREELDVLEIASIAKYAAVKSREFYSIVAGGYCCSPLLEQLSDYAAKIRLCWQDLSPEQQTELEQRIKYIRTLDHRAELSTIKLGRSHWTPESIERMVRKRKEQIALGIAVPPHGNRGNTEFRHTPENKVLIRMGVAKARERIFSERETYHTQQGMISMREKIADHYTPEVRENHSSLVRKGKARRLAEYEAQGIAPPKFHWYHNPANPKERATFPEGEPVPDGWVAGMGNGRKRRIDMARVIELISAGLRDADIARALGCAPSSVWQIRHDLETK